MSVKDYKISVITPIYNVEDYLEEAIESVIGQTLGFKDNVQLILVNDGSPDESYKICEKYKSLYPENIVYIEKENGGVSSARNEGLRHVKGRYVVFLDGDDLWEKRSFKKIVNFFDANYEQIDVCSCRLEYIGDFSKRKHPLEYKYKEGDRVIDLIENPTYICTTIGNSVFKSKSIENHYFDETMQYCEDAWFQNTVIAEKQKVGIVAGATFYYRKGETVGNTSLSVTRTDFWYFSVPENYYLKLLLFAKEKYGYIPRFLQETIFYDIKWRGYSPAVMEGFSEQQKQSHIELLRKSLELIDDEVILKAKSINQYKKLYFLNMKHNKNLVEDAERVGSKFLYKGEKLLNLKNKTILEIKTMSLDDSKLVLEGVCRLGCINGDYNLYAIVERKKKVKIPVETKPYLRGSFKGIIGENIVEADSFSVSIPIRRGSKIRFIAKINGKTVKLNPRYHAKTGLTNKYHHSYCIMGDYLLKLVKGEVTVYGNRKKTHLASELRLLKEVQFTQKAETRRLFFSERISVAISRRALLKNRVAFISIRSDELLGNMEKVYNQLNVPKIKYSKLRLGDYPECIKKARKISSTSRIVVTDDYLFLMKEKKAGQKYIQLWHSTGAGKYFGQDGTTMLLGEDAQYHKNYDVVTVSAEKVREVFSSAFAIPIDKIYATGVARTDDFFDTDIIQNTCDDVFKTYPNFKGKEVILYAPTFRDVPGLGRSVFRPRLDFDKLSEALSADQIFVIRPHPIMTAPILNKQYDNIFEVRNISTNDLMFISSLLITDYSSTMFEYSLLKKPMAFFCYDYDEYDRDFYMDFDNDLPGPMFRTQEELFSFLQKRDFPMNENYEVFYNKYMSACDGHSTERIVKMIEDMYYGKE